MLLSQSDLHLVAGRTGLGGAGIMRLLGSVLVALPSAGRDEDSTLLELGLCLMALERTAGRPGSHYTELVCDALIEYMRSCSAVTNWVLRGGFRADRIPEHIKRGEIKHACRTAGRLRAKFLRQSGLGESSVQ